MAEAPNQINIVGAAIALVAVILVFAMWLLGMIETDLAVQLEIFWLAVLAGMLGYQMNQIQQELRRITVLISKKEGE